jgi:hypothetical protein
MRLKCHGFELNVKQIEYFALIWIIQPGMKQQCTFYVLFVLFEVQGRMHCSIYEEPHEVHSGATSHLIDAFRHTFGPLLASTARFFGISGTSRWKV